MPRSSTPARIIMPMRVRVRNSQSATPTTTETTSTMMRMVGYILTNGSGDFAIAFSTNAANRVSATNGPQPRAILPTDAVSGLFEAVLDATEEAVYNSLLRATTVTSGRTTIEAIPIERVRDILKRYGR